MNGAEIRKLTLEKEIQEKSLKVVNLTNKVAKQTVDNRSGSVIK